MLDVLQATVDVVVLLSLPIAFWQLHGVNRDRNLSAMQDVFAGFHEPASYRDRTQILVAGPVDVKRLDEAEFELYMRTADFFQRLGFLTRKRFVSTGNVLEMYSGTVVSLWICLKPFVQYMRTDQGLSNYSADFELLAGAAAKHREKMTETLRFSEPGHKPWLHDRSGDVERPG